nr:hypothetical protein CFP56_05424 [Quercus suber]
MCVIEAKGITRGLSVTWKDGLLISQMEFNKNLIAIKVSDALCDWVMVGFYDPSYLAKKQKAWENLMAFINSCLCPWVCIGDFNFTNNDKEIFGGNRSGESSAINYLKEFIFEFSAIDLGFSGNSYTWARGRWGSSAIKRRLDRGIASILWRLAFPSAAMAHLGAFKSNHTPILLDTNPKDSFAHRPFRFEAAWIRDSGCNSIVEKAWNVQARGPTFFKLLKKQANTRDALRKWNKEVFGHCQARINLLMEKITKVQRKPPSKHNGKIEKELHLELSEWLFKSEIIWKRKSCEL